MASISRNRKLSNSSLSSTSNSESGISLPSNSASGNSETGNSESGNSESGISLPSESGNSASGISLPSESGNSASGISLPSESGMKNMTQKTPNTNKKNKTKKNNKNDGREPTSVELYDYLYRILSETHNQKGQHFTPEKFFTMMNRFLQGSEVKRHNNKTKYNNYKDAIIQLLDRYKQNFIMAKAQIDAKLTQGKYNFYEVNLHGTFDKGINFKKLPSNVVLCFLAPINRIGVKTCFTNPKMLLKINNESDKQNSSHPVYKMLENLLCYDKFTDTKNNSEFDNNTIMNSFLRDAQIYLPNQVYPDLYLSANGNSYFLDGVENYLDKYETYLSNFINNQIQLNSQNIHYFLIYSCRSFMSIKPEYTLIYEHEFLTYSLNLMLSSCNEYLFTGLYKSFLKDYPKKSTIESSIITFQKLSKLQQFNILLTINNFLQNKNKIIFEMIDQSLNPDLSVFNPDLSLFKYFLTFNNKKIFIDDYTLYAIIRYIFSFLPHKTAENPNLPHITETTLDGIKIMDQLNDTIFLNLVKKLVQNYDMFLTISAMETVLPEPSKNLYKNMKKEKFYETLDNFEGVMKDLGLVYNSILLKRLHIPKQIDAELGRIFKIMPHYKLSRMLDNETLNIHITNFKEQMNNFLRFPLVNYLLIKSELEGNVSIEFHHNLSDMYRTGYLKSVNTKNKVSFGRNGRSVARNLILERAKKQLVNI